MHSSAKLQYPPVFVVCFCSCDNVYHKPEVSFFGIDTVKFSPRNLTLSTG